MIQEHVYNIIGVAILTCGTMLQIIEPSFTDLLNLDKIGTIGLLIAAVWYFKSELSQARKEYDEKLREKDAQIAELRREIIQLLKFKNNE